MTIENLFIGILILGIVVIAIVAYRKRKGRGLRTTILVLPVWALGVAVGTVAPMGWGFLRDSYYPGSLVEWNKIDKATQVAAREQAYLYANTFAYVLAGLVLVIVVFVTVKKKWTPLRIAFLVGLLVPSILGWLIITYWV